MVISKVRLEEDRKIFEQMKQMEKEGKEKTKEYKRLFKRYFEENEDIRAYWKLY